MAVTSGCVGVPMMSRCLPASSACRAITWIFLTKGHLTQAHGLEALDDVAVVDDRPERHGRRAGLRGLLRQAHGPLHAEAEARRLS